MSASLITSGGAVASGGTATVALSAASLVGTNFISVGVGAYDNTPSVSDNQGNTYTLAKQHGQGGGTTAAYEYYCPNPAIPGSGNLVISVTGASPTIPAIGVACWGGLTDISSPYVDETAGAASASPGSITTSINNQIVTTVVASLDGSAPTISTSGFNLIAHNAVSGGTYVAFGYAYNIVASSGSTESPTWSASSSPQSVAVSYLGAEAVLSRIVLVNSSLVPNSDAFIDPPLYPKSDSGNYVLSTVSGKTGAVNAYYSFTGATLIEQKSYAYLSTATWTLFDLTANTSVGTQTATNDSSLTLHSLFTGLNASHTYYMQATITNGQLGDIYVDAGHLTTDLFIDTTGNMPIHFAQQTWSGGASYPSAGYFFPVSQDGAYTTQNGFSIDSLPIPANGNMGTMVAVGGFQAQVQNSAGNYCLSPGCAGSVLTNSSKGTELWALIADIQSYIQVYVDGVAGYLVGGGTSGNQKWVKIADASTGYNNSALHTVNLCNAADVLYGVQVFALMPVITSTGLPGTNSGATLPAKKRAVMLADSIGNGSGLGPGGSSDGPGLAFFAIAMNTIDYAWAALSFDGRKATASDYPPIGWGGTGEFTGSISTVTNQLTVTAVAGGVVGYVAGVAMEIYNGASLVGTIDSFVSGTNGGIGVYGVTGAVTTASTSLTAFQNIGTDPPGGGGPFQSGVTCSLALANLCNTYSVTLDLIVWEYGTNDMIQLSSNPLPSNTQVSPSTYQTSVSSELSTLLSSNGSYILNHLTKKAIVLGILDRSNLLSGCDGTISASQVNYNSATPGQIADYETAAQAAVTAFGNAKVIFGNQQNILPNCGITYLQSGLHPTLVGAQIQAENLITFIAPVVAGTLSYTGTPAINNVQLTWVAATGGSGTGYTYNVNRSSHSDMSSPTTLSTGQSGTTYNDTSVSGATWYYQIEAFDSDSDNAFSNILTVAVPSTATTYTQAFSPSSGSGDPILTYTLNGTLATNVTITPDIGGPLFATFSPSTVTITAGNTTGTTTMTTAYIGVLTLNSTNNGGLTDPGSDTYSYTGPAISAGTISNTATGSTLLEFSATEASGGTAPYAHQWWYRVHNTGEYASIPGATGLTLTKTGLSPSTAYDFALSYIDNSGAGRQVIAYALDQSTNASSSALSGSIIPGYQSRIIGGD